jgi:hypothetical protein
MIIVFGLQIVLAFIAAFVGNAWLGSNNDDTWTDPKCFPDDYTAEKPAGCDNAFYVFYNVRSLGFVAFFGTWILIFTNFVPISLMVTLEMVKLG